MSLLNTLKSRVGVAVLTLSSAGALGIIAHEGLKLASYRDPIGIVTVCAGHTATAKLGQVKTTEQCAELLKSDVKYAEAAVKRLVTVKLTQKQFDSLVSFTFNVGEGNLSSSTLLKYSQIEYIQSEGLFPTQENDVLRQMQLETFFSTRELSVTSIPDSHPPNTQTAIFVKSNVKK